MSNELVKVSLDTAMFKQTLSRYALQSSRTIREVINRTALNLAFESMNETKRARRDEIDKLGTKADPKARVWWRYIKKLIRETGFNIANTTAKSVSKLKRKKGSVHSVIGTGVSGRDLTAVSEKVKAGRRRAIGYIASGWLPAVEFFWNRVKDKPFRRGGNKPKQFGPPQGRGYESGATWNPAAHIENKTDAAGRIAGLAYRKSLRNVGVEMVRYMRERMEKAALKARRRVLQ